mmetsp:Transcript_13098/g.23562  ORF Transcript_13098/g.23562 Transcript_13098/m.23562 type:complete len:157 (+) Transcript_13098:41-511(+)
MDALTGFCFCISWNGSSGFVSSRRLNYSCSRFNRNPNLRQNAGTLSSTYKTTMILPLVAVEDVILEPQPMQSIIVLAVTAALGLFWWFSIVPSERSRLAKRKRKKGADVRTYIEELRDSPENSRKVEKWMYTEWLSKLPKSASPDEKQSSDSRRNE